MAVDETQAVMDATIDNRRQYYCGGTGEDDKICPEIDLGKCALDIWPLGFYDSPNWKSIDGFCPKVNVPTCNP